MTERNSLMQEVGAALRDQGITAAITALIGGTIALLAAVSRRAFTNDAMLARLGTSSRLWEPDQKKIPLLTQTRSRRLTLLSQSIIVWRKP